jgi:hypothetical protein
VGFESGLNEVLCDRNKEDRKKEKSWRGGSIERDFMDALNRDYF